MVGNVVPNLTRGAVAFHAVLVSKRPGDMDPGSRVQGSRVASVRRSRLFALSALVAAVTSRVCGAWIESSIGISGGCGARC